MVQAHARPALAAAPEPELGGYFVAAYPPFERWHAVESAELDPLFARAPRDVPLGLYVHVPFCVQRCSYCYYLASDAHAPRAEYVDALAAELALHARAPLVAGRALDFVYFGGGTPSSLSAREVERLCAALQRVMPWSAAREVTFECAPRTVTDEKARVLADAGVTRVSLGVQQLDDSVLARSGRVHRVADVERAYAALRRAGFARVNLDLMVGLPGETEDGFLRSLERTIALAPEQVTLYQLEIPPHTPLHRLVEERGGQAMGLASWPEKHARTARGFARLGAGGYALRSAYTAHRGAANRAFVYQDEQYAGADLLGIGASAFSYLAGTHFQDLARPADWLAALARGERPVARAHALTAGERLVRALVLRLKLLRVPLAPLAREFGVDPRAAFAAPLARCAEAGWLVSGEDAVEVTPAGVPYVDRMLPEFYGARASAAGRTPTARYR